MKILSDEQIEILAGTSDDGLLARNDVDYARPLKKQLPQKRNGFVYIYSLSDIKTGEIFYVGQTEKPRSRYMSHVYRSELMIHMNILECVPSVDANTIEQKYIHDLGRKHKLKNKTIASKETLWRRIFPSMLYREQERLSQ